MNRTAGNENSENRAVGDDRRYRTYKKDWSPTGETSNEPQYPGQVAIGEWHRLNTPQYRSHEPIAEPVRGYTAFGCAWRIAVAVLVVYVLLTAALVLTHHA